MTTLVTGGAGYIGSHTVRQLVNAGRDVVVFDSLELGHREALLGTELVVGNIANQDLITTTCKKYGITEVIHFAAYKSVGESMSNPGRYFSNNVTGSTLLVEALAQAGVDKVVFSSSASVYGTPETVPVREDAPLHPESVYAETKYMTERMLQWFSETHGLRSVSLRYFNAAGDSFDSLIGEDWSVTTNLVPVVMKATLGKRDALEVFGDDYPTRDGTGIRDYIHVVDLADAHVKALNYLADGKPTTSCNVGTGKGTTVLEVIQATERISGRQVPYVMSPRRAGDPIEVYADPTFAAQTLGWHAQYSLDDIIATAWQWHSTHIEGYAK